MPDYETLVCYRIFAFFIRSHRPFSPLLIRSAEEPEVERKVVSKVAPIYPDLARKTNIHGAVKLGVVIAPDGRVESTRVIGGNPVLIQAAIDAVRKWRYEAGPRRSTEVVELKFGDR
jgi:TonB family protein